MKQNIYSEKLRDPRWQKKRLEILTRDEWCCQRCFDSESTLMVHHRRYLPNKEPWDYSNNLLVTLCENCHEEEKETRKDYESDLLSILKEKFFVGDIAYLINGFLNLYIRYDSNVTASIIEYALKTPEIMDIIENEYFTSIAKIAKKAGS